MHKLPRVDRRLQLTRAWGCTIISRLKAHFGTTKLESSSALYFVAVLCLTELKLDCTVHSAEQSEAEWTSDWQLCWSSLLFSLTVSWLHRLAAIALIASDSAMRCAIIYLHPVRQNPCSNVHYTCLLDCNCIERHIQRSLIAVFLWPAPTLLFLTVKLTFLSQCGLNWMLLLYQLAHLTLVKLLYVCAL